MAREKARPTRKPTSPRPPAPRSVPPSPPTRGPRWKWPLLAIGFLVLGVAVAGAWWWTHQQSASTRAPDAFAARAEFIDEARCAGCHAAEHKAWIGSHHDRAMEPATPATVLGDFSNAGFNHRGIQARFFQRDGEYWVNADGPDGKPADFHVKYTFGVDPLQQYLLELPQGRLQAFTTAWDVKRKQWFSLHANERIDFRDELHWTRPAQNWNYMCAECHSTDLHKNYDASSNAYKTSYAQIDVGCQSCHGPGSRHVAWAEQGGAANGTDHAQDVGLEVSLAARDAGQQIETCARCHSRRAAFWGDYRHGKPLMDTHLPSLLEEHIYQADGQILEEVYEYGSFLQSRMYAKGLRCSDCHEPHSLKLRAEGNALCANCHNVTGHKARASIDVTGLKHKDYDSPAHHFHQAGSSGAQCVNCHMASRNYMVIDPRRDHSFRIPRPDLSLRIGTPNACTSCHTGKTAPWAADAVARWYGPGRRMGTHYGEALWAGRTRQAGAAGALATLVRDASQPDIVRASALDLLRQYPGRLANQVVRDALAHSNPMMRRAALLGLDGLPLDQRVGLVAPLLRDPVRAVRIEAARLLAGVSPAQLDGTQSPALDSGLAEFEAAQRENADRPEGHINLGSLYVSLRKPDQAEAEYRKAIELDPAFVPAYVNLADLQRASNQEQQAEQTLRFGLRAVPANAALHHALGLSLVRQGRAKEALGELAVAAKRQPDDPRYAYVYGVALHDLGRAREGIAVLEATSARFPGDRNLLTALSSYSTERGDTKAAAGYDQRLRELGDDAR